MDFTALDIGLAKSEPQSICRVALVRVESNRIALELDLLVQPPKNSYSTRLQTALGMGPCDTENAPLWPEIWPELRPYVEDQLVVSATAAQLLDCLFEVQHYYMLPHPVYTFECLHCLTGMNLGDACADLGMRVDGLAHAMSRARTVARLYMMLKGMPALQQPV